MNRKERKADTLNQCLIKALHDVSQNYSNDRTNKTLPETRTFLFVHRLTQDINSPAIDHFKLHTPRGMSKFTTASNFFFSRKDCLKSLDTLSKLQYAGTKNQVCRDLLCALDEEIKRVDTSSTIPDEHCENPSLLRRVAKFLWRKVL